MPKYQIDSAFTQNVGAINLCPELFRAALALFNWSADDLAWVAGFPPRPLRSYARGEVAVLTSSQLDRILTGFCRTLAFTPRGDLAKGVRFATRCAPFSLDAGIDGRPSRLWKAPPSAFDPERAPTWKRERGGQ
jgi:hypothetical protein